MFGKLLPARLAATSSPAPQFQFQLGPHTQTPSKKASSVFKKLLHVKNVFNRTSSAEKHVNSQGTSPRRQGIPAPPLPSQGLTTLTSDDRSGFDRRPYHRSPLAPPQSVATIPVVEPSPTSSSFRCSKPSSSLLPASPIVAELEGTTAFMHRQSNDSARAVHSTIQDNIPAQLVDESDSAKKKLDALRKQIFAVDKDCSQLEKQLHEECDKFGKAKVALKEARSDRDETDKKYATLQVERRNLQLGKLVGDKWRPLGSEASQRYFEPSQPAAGQEKKKRGASLAASKSSRRKKVVIKSWDSRWAALMIPERYSVHETDQATEIGAESVQEDSRPESGERQSAKSAAPYPSHWMTQSLLGGPDKKAPHSSTPQGPVATFNKPGQQTNDQRGHDAHQVDPSDYNSRP